ncbi:filamentous hemagglutinin N-terminal domain-containing protein, partial [Psychromonas sp.]|nr:filamentous hemagglutinin N-terminal domain-containing protein [Psychromonas sp.]
MKKQLSGMQAQGSHENRTMDHTVKSATDSALIHGLNTPSRKRLTATATIGSLSGPFHQPLLKSIGNNKGLQKRFRFSGTALSVCIAFATLNLIPTLFHQVSAEPSGAVIVGGTGTITVDDLSTIIDQTSDNMAIDWDSYNIDATESVIYNQPDSTSISLNNILSSDGSVIAGSIESNGVVILANPNGLLFTGTSVINVGSIIASGLQVNSSDFMNGEYVLTELLDSEGTVINYGLINASVGGNVALIGKQVENHGLIQANLGTVTLASGKQSVLTFDNSGLLGVSVTEAMLQDELGVDAAVLNSGEINAAGGKVLLTASVSQDIFSQAVNAGDYATSVVVHEDGSFTLGDGADLVNTGSIDVSSSDTVNDAGQIVLLGDNVTSSGDLLAKTEDGEAGHIELHATDTTLLTGDSQTQATAGENATGGTIKILGENVGLFDNASVDASGGDGGEIYIGGGLQGEDDGLRNATYTYIGEETSVSADGMSSESAESATESDSVSSVAESESSPSGDGGTVIVFAEDTTRVYGQLSATGGEASGDGGFVETSGLKGFDITTTPDVSAENGDGGEWLIDPYNITIVNDSTETTDLDQDSDTDTDDAVFTSIESDTEINVSLIKNALFSGTSVTIQTSTSTDVDPSDTDTDSTGEGNITWTADLDFNDTGEGTLILDAANDITLASGSIYDGNTSNNDGTGDSLNVALDAGDDIIIADGFTISTEDGALSMIAVGDVTIGTESGIEGTEEEIGYASITTDGGNVDIDAGGDVSFGAYSSISSEGGNVSIYKTDTDDEDNKVAAGEVTFLSNSSITTEGGTFTSNSETFDSSLAEINTTGAENANGGVIEIITSGLDTFIKDNTTGEDTEEIDKAALIVGVLTADGGVANRDGGNGVEGRDGGDITLSSTLGSIVSNGAISSVGTTGDYSDSGSLSGQDGGDGGAVSILSEGEDTTVTINATINTNGADANGDDKDSDYDVNDIDDGGAGSLNEADGGDAGGISIAAETIEVNGALSALGGDGIGSQSGATAAGSGGSGGTVSIIGNEIKLNENIDVTDGLNGELLTHQEIADAALSEYTTALAFLGDLSEVEDGYDDADTAVTEAYGTYSDAVDDVTELKSAIAITINGDAGSVTVNKTTAFTSTVNVEVQDDDIDDSIAAATGTQTLTVEYDTGGSDTLSWSIGLDNAGEIEDLNLTFSDIENLTGGTQDDTFVINASDDTVSVSIDGGGGDNTLTGDDAANRWVVDSDYSGTLYTEDSYDASNVTSSISYATFENIQNLVATSSGSYSNTFDISAEITSITGKGGADTFNLNGDSDVTNVWGNDGADTFNIEATASVGTLYGGNQNDAFTVSSGGEVNYIYGNGHYDTFYIYGEVGEIDGGSHRDNFYFYDGSDVSSATGNSGSDLFYIYAGASVTSSLTGGAGDDTFYIYAGASVTSSLTGGAGDDTFYIYDGANITSTVSGGDAGDASVDDGSNTLSYIYNTTTSAWQLTSANAGTVTSVENSTSTSINFSEIQTIIGGSGTDTLTALNQDNAWSITSADTGSVSLDSTEATDSIDFSSIENLTGGSGDDTFTFVDGSTTGSISGDITGGTGTDTLIAKDVENAWSITDENTGTLSTSTDGTQYAEFAGIENITGGDANDTFTFTRTNDDVTGSISGTVSGGSEDDAGTDTLIAKDVANEWNVTAAGVGVLYTDNADVEGV